LQSRPITAVFFSDPAGTVLPKLATDTKIIDIWLKTIFGENKTAIKKWPQASKILISENLCLEEFEVFMA
jgi:hypothetical protein